MSTTKEEQQEPEVPEQEETDWENEGGNGNHRPERIRSQR